MTEQASWPFFGGHGILTNHCHLLYPVKSDCSGGLDAENAIWNKPQYNSRITKSLKIELQKHSQFFLQNIKYMKLKATK
jgi:hypothetical protein